MWDAAVDVLVIGAGGGGLVAALTARGGGAEVAIVEKALRVGGNTGLSSGSVPGAGTRFQARAGIDDSPARFAADVRRQTRGSAPAHLVDSLTRESAPLVEWLVDEIGLPMELMSDVKKVGHSLPRLHAPPGRQGSTLVEGLERAARDADITISFGQRARSLISDDNGAVVGAEIGSEYDAVRVRACKVVLACNGFGASRTLLRRYIPNLAEAQYFGHPDNNGDGILWGMALGARTRALGAYQGHAAVADPHGVIVSWAAVERGGFLVDRDGRRFVNEDLGYSGCAAAVLRRPEARAWVVMERRLEKQLLAEHQDFCELDALGAVKRGADIVQLGQACGIDGAALSETLATFNDAASGGSDSFGRRAFGLAPLRPPFAVVRVTSGLFHTQGGLDIDAEARPLRNDGTPIPNLYAVGGAAVGLSGESGGDGYCSGNGLLTALGLGRIAGRHAARSL